MKPTGPGPFDAAETAKNTKEERRVARVEKWKADIRAVYSEAQFELHDGKTYAFLDLGSDKLPLKRRESNRKAWRVLLGESWSSFRHIRTRQNIKLDMQEAKRLMRKLLADLKPPRR